MDSPGVVVHELIEAIDWVGTFVFALAGGLLGVKKRFDLFGVLFLAFVTAVAGGMIRDLLIGAVPPVASSDMIALRRICRTPGLPALSGGPILSDAVRPVRTHAGWASVASTVCRASVP